MTIEHWTEYLNSNQEMSIPSYPYHFTFRMAVVRNLNYS
jgi:hypothetical protein